MKLLKRSYFSALKWLLPVIILSSVYCYFMIEYIEHEETDEFLTYEMNRLIAYHETYHNLPEYHKVTDIIPDLKCQTPIFKDTLLLEPADNEMVPHRELRFGIEHNGKNFTIVLRHLMLGVDDMIEGTVFIVLGIISLLVLFVIVVIERLNRKIWQPFYSTLTQLMEYRIDQPAPEFNKTQIEEFTTLNNTLSNLLKKTSGDYKRSKEFNENVSHELQTHLAVIRANTEKILNKPNVAVNDLKEIKKIYEASTELSRIQKSLSLLNKIENKEFNRKERFDLAALLFSILSNYEEVLELENIQLKLDVNSSLITMDKGLATIILNNLIKNAIKHNLKNGYINISLTNTELWIENSGETLSIDPLKLFDRFKTGAPGGSGIGLSIVYQICELNNFKLEYSCPIQGVHLIKIAF